MRRFVCLRVVALFAMSLAIVTAGCSGSSSSNPSANPAAGVANVAITDAASLDYAHVYVTVTGVAFHTLADSGFSDYSSAKQSQWQITRLADPVTVDLAQLVNGKTNSLFNGITLPNGQYRQIRIFLASTEDALAPSAAALGLTYNNEVQLNGDTSHYPLRIPTAKEGISLIPEAPVTVSDGTTANLVLDFNLNNDVVEVSPNGSTEFILKPRLGYFDMSSVGAVTGTVSFGNLSTSRIVVKAEQVKSGASYRITRRLGVPDKSTGAFALNPLPIFGSATTASYDILIRGRHLDTAVIKGVKVHKGGSTDLGAITLQPDQEFTAQVGQVIRPTGSWVNFYQTLGSDPIPYEVRYRHLNPYTGKFFTPEPLSAGPVQVATYTGTGALAFVPDASCQGIFTAVAEAAGRYSRGAVANVTGTPNAALLIDFTNKLPVPTDPQQISATFDMEFFGTGMGHGMGGGRPGAQLPTKGEVFVTQGGMIIDAQGTLTLDTSVQNAMHAGGGVNNPAIISSSMPGGVTYGLYALGWGNNVLAAGSVQGIDLPSGGARVNIKMR